MNINNNPLFQRRSLNLFSSFLLTILFFASFSFDVNAVTFTVTNTNNAGLGSFRKAVIDAGLNTSSTSHTINFSDSLIGSTIIVFNEPIIFLEAVVLSSMEQERILRYQEIMHPQF